MALTKVTYPLIDTPLPYSVIKGAPISVLDYADLAVVTACRDPLDPNSHLLTSFLNWTPAINAALDAAAVAGGGSVVLPKNTVPYYVQDEIVVKSNTTFVCEDWIVLADYNLVGHTLTMQGENILIVNLKIDNSGIFAGGSGYNGVWAKGNNVKLYGGHIKNCARGNVPPADGGKGVQTEDGSSSSIVVDGVTFTNCFMALSSRRDFTDVNPYKGILFDNITAYSCNIFAFIQQSNATQSQTGLQHSVQINNFYAYNCGSFEGIFQFSRASNIKISNGIVVGDPGTVTTSLIRGNHANCVFDNIGWYGTADAVINLDPGTYCIDSSQANQNNVYNLNVWGSINYVANVSGTTSYRTLNSCIGQMTFQNDVGTAFFGYELRNGVSSFTLTQGSKTIVLSTPYGYAASGADPGSLLKKFADAALTGVGIPWSVDNMGAVFMEIATSYVPNNCLFANSATGKLSYKDSGGTVHVLY